MKKLLTPYFKEALSLKNHLVMAPMTRSRALHNIPNDLMREYYEQRSGAGLIITEGTSPSPSGLGYSRIPGIFNQAQIEGWGKITSAVHKNGSKLFMQLMHCGRIAHVSNLPEGAKVIGVSSKKASGQIYSDSVGLQDHSEPEALSTEGIYKLMEEFDTASKNAVEAGCDGVELHGANGYLLEQFLNPHVNTRTDSFGGSVEKRASFILSLVDKLSGSIGKEKIGIRFSPFSTFNDMEEYDKQEVHETYSYLALELNKRGIAYIHINTNPAIPAKTMESIRSNFKGTLILCSGFTPETGEKALQNAVCDLIAFGRYFIANPDFDKRIETESALTEVNFQLLYTPGKEGYTDYPFLHKTIK